METQQHGLDTPEPVVVIEQFQNGLLSYSYYICCYDGGETVHSLIGGKVEGGEDKLSAFTCYATALHQTGTLRLDYSPSNILTHQNETDEYSFSPVDVNRMQLLSDIDCDMVCRNMCHLCILREVLTYIMTEYASLRGWNVEPTVSLALHYSDQFFTRYIYCRAAQEEKEEHIVPLTLPFRLYRSVREFSSQEPHISHSLLGKEKYIYDTYLCKYDYCKLLSADCQ